MRANLRAAAEPSDVSPSDPFTSHRAICSSVNNKNIGYCGGETATALLNRWRSIFTDSIEDDGNSGDVNSNDARQ